jgi:hypothetical protein
MNCTKWWLGHWGAIRSQGSQNDSESSSDSEAGGSHNAVRMALFWSMMCSGHISDRLQHLAFTLQMEAADSTEAVITVMPLCQKWWQYT